MDNKSRLLIFIGIILSIISVTSTGIINYNNYTNDTGQHVNKTGDTMTGALIVPQLRESNDGDDYYINLTDTGLWGYWKFFGDTYTLWKSTWSKFYFYTNVDFGGYNLSNCGNCAYESDIVSDGTKVNKSGDNMTGILQINNSYQYTGAQRMLFKIGRNNTPVLWSVAQNDLNGAVNFRINVNDDNSQQDITGAGIAMSFQPQNNRVALVMCKENTTACFNIYDMYMNDTALGKPLGEINLGYSSNTSQYPVTVYNLAGSGNAYVCVDSAGKLYRGSPTC